MRPQIVSHESLVIQWTPSNKFLFSFCCSWQWWSCQSPYKSNPAESFLFRNNCKPIWGTN